jgi:hypothetical protein
MEPPIESDEFEFPTETRRGQAARVNEGGPTTAARWSIPLFVPDVCSCSTSRADILRSPSEFEADISICVGTDRTCVLEEGEGGMHTELSILSAFVGFGFGAGIVRMIYTTVLTTVL